ncbi:MAG TPA: xanthine dehydrogenase family protein molybdopterin-binding subunit [Candidatus Paceibacterota bacterium]|nr:xanthine dehydrogenase family protein molybdopterin-binding subunit [Verrucomicrobiota bacterium]HRY49024.1 xanthine dehydrogenase family protein molybdopterin-binding subunit [Candidatus Paceibacterota bacterium]
MPTWPKESKFISKNIRRIDGPAKVTGSAKYTSDVQPEGCLYGMILRSRWPAARITRINLDKARQVAGFRAAVLVREGERRVRYYGEELAAVACATKQACQDALRAIEVEAVPLPFVVREEDAIRTDSPRVWDDSPNLSKAGLRERGDVTKALADSAVVVEGFFSTPVQVHHPLETHGNTASWTDEELTVWSSTQGIFSVRDGLAGNLNLEQNKIRVISEYMGGGFGAKFGPGVEGALAARLSRAAKAPVKLMLTRFDQSLAVGNRPSSYQKIKLGAAADGKLLAFELDAYGTAGIGSGGSTEGGGGGAEFPAPYIYQIPNIRVSHRGVTVNAGSARAFRAPGHPQASFGMESILDELAVKLNIDPVELRILNDPFEIRRKEYQLGAERFGWKEKYRKPGSSPGSIKTGVGCAGAMWGGGGGGTQAEAQVNPDGAIEIRCGTQDLGTGTKTVIAAIGADLLGLTPDQIAVRIGDTRFPPSGGSGGSTTAASVSPAVHNTCQRVLEELQKVSGMSDVRGENWKSACKKLGVNPLVVPGKWVEGLSSSGVGGVQFAEVEVDTQTGFVKVKKITCVQDCGLVVSRLTCESQVNGGIIMGIGYALYEERVMDRASGMLLNPNFETYKLPGLADVPEIDIVLLDMPERGVIGIGEPVTIPTASAIANAVANALGVRIGSLPVTPAKILAALDKSKATA